MDNHHQDGRRIDTKDLSYVYGPLIDHRNSRSRYVVRQYNDVFTFDNFEQYWDFNTDKEGLFELMNTLRSNDSSKRGNPLHSSRTFAQSFCPVPMVFVLSGATMWCHSSFDS